MMEKAHYYLSSPSFGQSERRRNAAMERIERLARRAPVTIPQRATAIGIDLGTTSSSVGIFRNGKVEIITNDLGNKRTPSLVAFTENRGFVVGEAATSIRTTHPMNTVFDTKRLLGRRFDEPIVQEDMKHWPFKVVDEKGWPKISVECNDRLNVYLPERIMSILLIKLKGMAEAYLGEIVTEAVITVPAHFNEYQKQATKDAAKTAGLGVMRILKESAAAAMAYKVLHNLGSGLRKEEHNVLIFDLGGGSFDVSVLSIHDSVLEVKSTGGDTHLGGVDFDNRIANHVAANFFKKHGKDPTTNKVAMERLRVACEEAKLTLSTATQATISIDSFLNGVNLRFDLSRGVFEEICEDLFSAVMDAVDTVIKDAKLDRCALHEIVPIGGCSAIPRIQELLQTMFPGRTLNRKLDSVYAVAHGAALQAGILMHDSQILESMLLLDVTPHALGIETQGGLMSIVVKRDSAIPTRLSRSFTTCYDNQSAAIVKIFEGSRPSTRENNLLGLFTMTGLPQAPAGEIRIDITFNVDADGTLEVSAYHKASGKKMAIVIMLDKDQLVEEAKLRNEQTGDYALVEYKFPSNKTNPKKQKNETTPSGAQSSPQTSSSPRST